MRVINLPKEGASDLSANLIEIFFENDSKIHIGDIICEIETSKAIHSIETEYEGFVYLLYEVGDKIDVGSPLCFIEKNKISYDEYEDKKNKLVKKQIQNSFNSKTISLKAQLLIEKNSIDINFLHEDIITVKVIKEYLARTNSVNIIESHKKFNERDIIIYGIGGHAGMCIDIINLNSNYNLVGFIDDNKVYDKFYNLPYFGTIENINKLIELGLKNLVIGIGFLKSLKKRDILFNNLKSKINIPTIIHESAIIEPSSKIATGCQIMAGSIIGSNVTIGENCIINSGSIISHNTIIKNSTHITPGAVIAGHVKIGNRVTIGMGSTVFIGLSVSDDIVVRNNESILNNI